ncbi:aminotransferase [Abortiporus biennis]|nr:aminotransferase [Abortiporus biennis]
MSDESYQLFTATRYDTKLLDIEWNTRVNDGPTPIMLLKYHRDRLIYASTKHGWTDCIPSITTESITSVVEDATQNASTPDFNGPFKVRIVLDRDAKLSATATPTIPYNGPDPLTPSEKPEHIRTIYVDPQPTPSSIFTLTKTTRRAHYTAARSRVQLGPMPTPTDSNLDVVLYTPDGLLTETSLRNIAFWRDDKWVTPKPATSGCLPGTTTRYLLETGKFVEGDVKVDELEDGDLVMTSNSAEGCVLGRIALKV